MERKDTDEFSGCYGNKTSLHVLVRQTHIHDPNLPDFICSDVDECATGKGGCSDVCRNTVGGFECHCRTGRRPTKGDKNKCEGR